MPLQWLNLQQRQKQQPRSAVSEALTPRPRGGGITPTSMAGGFVEQQKAKWAEEDKLKKLERDAKTQEAQEMGMRIRDVFEKEKARGRAMSAQAARGAPAEAAPTAAPTTTLDEDAVMKEFEFISTLDPESQKFYIKTLKEKELGTSGYIESKGKRIKMPGSVGKYYFLVDRGLIDPATDTVIEKERVFEKGTFKEMEDGSILNEATGEIIARAGDVPPDWGVVYTEVLAEGLKHIKEMMDASWMQTMDTDEMNKHIEAKKNEYRDWIAGRLFSKGMTDKNEINKLADLAIGSYNWQKHLDEAKTREKTLPPTEAPTETNRGLPLDESVVTGLKELFRDSPEELDNIEKYKDEYGEANVNKALEKETKKTFKTYTEGLKPLGEKKKPTEFKKWGAL